MTKYSAFGTQLQLGNGTLQVETATVVGTITQSGNATFTVTSTGMTGSPKAISVAVLINDTASMVAQKAIQTLRADSAVAAMYFVGGTGATVVLTRKIATADVANLNIAFTNDTCLGLTPNATSANTVVGGLAEVFTTIAGVTNIAGPGLGLDTEDVTTHDSTAYFEEVIPTILRSGEVSLDLVYDPNDATQNDSTGLISRIENKILANYRVNFPGSVTWAFTAYATGFEPSASVDGALTGTATFKITGQPTLA